MTARGQGGPIQAHRARETGRVVEVWHADDLGDADEAGPWVTICVEHATSIHHATRALAVWHSANPTGWCEVCSEVEEEARAQED